MRQIFFAIILSLYFFVFGNWILGFTSLDEGRNASAILNMIRSGDLLVPYYNCEPRFEKPPMLYWIALLFSELFGLNEFSTRLVSGLSALGVATLTYLIAKRQVDEDTARKSFLVLLTLPHMWVESRALVPEMLNTFFMMVALYFLLSGRILVGWLFMSLSFLTKGPVGVLLILLVYMLWRRDLRVLSLRGILIFSVLGGSWYFYMLYKFGYYYFFRFFIYENVMRYTGERLTHPSPFYYYIVIVLITTIFYLPKYPDVIKGFKKELFPYLVWFLSVVLFFSFAKNKLHHYILFAYPPLSVILARNISEKYLKKVLFFSVSALFILLALTSLYQKMRFTPKAYPFINSYGNKVYFYKSEDSSLVFYSQRCIPTLKDPRNLSGSLLVTKEKYAGALPQCKILLRGIEFDGYYVLLNCH
ncbi:MAG: glycosyltransferase family 39 protein [Hydrogenobacter sp.]|uniref:ArnT family glycosyltransferase n=1 Tax=Hydrogenobacter thermophilus TaxID=940 RepID=UPI0030F61FFE